MFYMKNVANRVSFQKPDNYDPAFWELARRYFTHPDISRLVKAPCGNIAGYCGGPSADPSKWDLNNGGPISTDFVGASWEYPTANYSRRDQINQEHKLYTQGFLWFMSTDPSLPASIRNQFSVWGYCKDEFVESGNFPTQLYVRAARRLVGDQVFTQNTPDERRNWGNLSIGCGSYNFDSHTAERIACPNNTACGAGPRAVSGAFAWNEGDVETAPGIYDIPLFVMLPKASEVSNLLVVGAPSATHIGMSTLRMEPQFMIIGQAAGVVAALASASGSVHTIDTTQLHARLLKGDQLMGAACQPTPPPPPPPPAPPVAVSEAGSPDCNGLFRFNPSEHRDPGVPFYTKDSGHQLYRLDGIWRIAHGSDPLKLYYTSNSSASPQSLPPTHGWVVARDGVAPPPHVGSQP